MTDAERLAVTEEPTLAGMQGMIQPDRSVTVDEMDEGTLRAEIERLRSVLRQTCVTECGPEYRDRDLHAPGCLADEAAP